MIDEEFRQKLLRYRDDRRARDNLTFDIKCAGVNPRVKRIGHFDGNYVRTEFLDLDRPDEPWFTTPANVLKGKRAPVKPYGGYKTNKPGVLYVLHSESESMYKIGITNDFDRRLAELVKGTYFEFEVYGKLSCEDGKLISDLETYVHQLLKVD